MNLSRADIVWTPKYKIGKKIRIGNETLKVVSIDHAKCVYIVAKRIELTEQFINDVIGE